MIKQFLEGLLTIFFKILFAFIPPTQDKNLIDTIKLYRVTGFNKLFLEIRSWDAPFVKIKDLIPEKGVCFDLGCGDGLLANYLALSSSRRQIIGIENNGDRIKIADKGLKNTKFIKGDITKIKISQAEAIFLIDVLHHLNSFYDQEMLLKYCFNQLKPNGKLIVAEISNKPFLKYLFTWFTDVVIVPILFERKLINFKVFFRDNKQWSILLRSLGYSVKMSQVDQGKPFSHIIFECQKKSTKS